MDVRITHLITQRFEQVICDRQGKIEVAGLTDGKYELLAQLKNFFPLKEEIELTGDMPLEKVMFNQKFVDRANKEVAEAVRAVRARGGALPGAEFYGSRAFKTTDVRVQWANPGDIELVFDIQWQRNICKVAGITPAPSGAILNMLEPYFTIARLKEGKQIGLPTHIENALELLDEPGEWYFNKATRWLYYNIRHRMSTAGCRRDVFSDDALLLMSKATGGIMRQLDVLGEHCLVTALKTKSNIVDAAVVQRAIQSCGDALL